MTKINTRSMISVLGAVALLSACVVQEPVYRGSAPCPRSPIIRRRRPAAEPAPAVASADVQASEVPAAAAGVLDQPPCPEEGYIWTPGYWNYGYSGYFWVPGTSGGPAAGWIPVDPRLTGDSWKARICSTVATGVRTSVSMVASTTAMATWGCRLRRRPLEWQSICLQCVGQQREHHDCAQHV